MHQSAVNDNMGPVTVGFYLQHVPSQILHYFFEIMFQKFCNLKHTILLTNEENTMLLVNNNLNQISQINNNHNNNNNNNEQIELIIPDIIK